jgi:UDP-GlcNAc3NAcA epimerase
VKLITVLGNRPQFIKAAQVSKHILKNSHIQETIIHTGQHYDKNMSEIFFDELCIPSPKYNLSIGSATHGKQTARMLEGIEDIILQEKPDALMVYGDTNSTLAGALAAGKLQVPVVHIEAGLRYYNKLIPEEPNRVFTDYLSSVLFCPTATAVENLKKEAIEEGVYNVGDVMLDCILENKEIALKMIPYKECISKLEPYSDIQFENINSIYKIQEMSYYLATIHRAENTDCIEKLSTIIESFEALDLPVLFLVHPRTINIIRKYLNNCLYKNILFVKPVSYFQMIVLMSHANKILTDSGGIQKEAYFLKIPCVTLTDQTEWIETLDGGWNVLCQIDKNNIVNSVLSTHTDLKVFENNYFGDGKATEKIIKVLETVFRH